MHNNISRLYARYRNLILYGVIGLVGASLDFLTFTLIIYLLPIAPWLASFISVSIGIVNNYILNQRYNFKVSGHLLTRFINFYMTGVGGAILSSVLIFITVDRFDMNALTAKLLTILPVVLLQFIINKHVSFSSDPKKLYRRLRYLIRTNRVEIFIVIAALCLYLIPLFSIVARDDMDNILAGKLMLLGNFPYVDFFSHHAPGMYLFSAMIYLFSGDNVLFYRLLFNLLVFVIVVYIYVRLGKKMPKYISRIYLLFAVLGHAIALQYVPLAESLVSVLLCVLLLHFVFETPTPNTKRVAVNSLIMFSIPFLSLTYILPLSFLYLLYIYHLVQLTKSSKEFLRLTSKYILILALPYLVSILAVLLLPVVRYDLLTFNSNYYAPMVSNNSGNITMLPFEIIRDWTQQAITLLRGLADPRLLAPMALFLSFPLLSFFLWKNDKRIHAVTLIMYWLFVSPLINVFNKPPISTDWTSLSQHAAPYITSGLFISSVIYSTYAFRRGGAMASRLASGVILLIIGVTLIGVYLGSFFIAINYKHPQNYIKYAVELPRSNIVRSLNCLTDVGDSVWIGPGNFAEQLYLEPKMATTFTFYLPWIDQDVKLRQKFIDELEQEKPKVIFFQQYRFLGRPYVYSEELRTFLSRNYFTSDDFQGYYLSTTSMSSVHVMQCSSIK